MGQQCEENFHFLPTLLNVADVIDYESLKAIQFLELLLQGQIDFGPQQSLYQQGAGREQNPAPQQNQLLAQSTDQMRLAASRVAESQDVLGAIQKRTFQQRRQLSIHTLGQARAVQRRQRFLPGKPGGSALALDFALVPLRHFDLR